MTQSILVKRFDNGLTLLAEPMPWLESAAMSLLAPAGCALDPPDRLGLANLTCEMLERGCGGRDSRQYVEELEMLGIDSSSSVLSSHTAFGGAMLADRLPEALRIFADVVRRPLFPEDEFEEARTVCLQDARSIEDDLARQAMNELVRRQYPDPWGRESHGSVEALEAMTLDEATAFFARHYHAQGAILSVAGKLDWAQLCRDVERLFGDWPPGETPPIVEAPCNGERVHHMPRESSQTHIAIAFDNIPYSHPDYYKARGAVGVLSDGMSSRLFTEVREKRGLSYSVYAMCHSLRDRGSVLAYAQTSVDKAQEACDVMLAELRRLKEGIELAELSRLKARVKRALIMQQESSSARASELASDWYYLGRVRTLAEIAHIIDQLTVESINAYLAANPPRDFRVVTLGGQGVEVTDGVS